jgi:hypothetical protein
MNRSLKILKLTGAPCFAGGNGQRVPLTWRSKEGTDSGELRTKARSQTMGWLNDLDMHATLYTKKGRNK